MSVHAEDIAHVAITATSYPNDRISLYGDVFVAKIDTGTCTVKGDACGFEMVTWLDYYESATEVGITVFVREADTQHEIGRFTTLDPRQWDRVEAFAPREEWPAEMFTGQRSVNETPDARLRQIIDAYDLDMWVPLTECADETGWADGVSITPWPEKGYQIAAIRSGTFWLDRKDPHGPLGAWLIAIYQPRTGSEGRPYTIVGCGTFHPEVREHTICKWFDSRRDIYTDDVAFHIDTALDD